MKKLKEILVKKVALRGKHPHINFNPTDDSKPIKESYLTEQPVKIKAKSAKTGRTLVKRFRSPAEASAHYHQWLTSGKLRNVTLISEQEEHKLIENSEYFEIPVDILFEVYERGFLDWTDDKPVTPNQWAFARVNSFIHGGRALELDEDLLCENKKYRITAKTSNKSLGKLAKRKDELGRQAKTELHKRLSKTKQSKFGNKKEASEKLQAAIKPSKMNMDVAKKLIKSLGVNPKSAVAKSLTKVAKKTDYDKQIKKEVKKRIKKMNPSKFNPASSEKDFLNKVVSVINDPDKMAKLKSDADARMADYNKFKEFKEKKEKGFSPIKFKPMPDVGPKEKPQKQKTILSAALKFFSKGKK